MKKRLLASFLALCLVLTLLPAAALADEGSPVEWSELTEAAKDSGGDTLDNTADEPDGPEAVDDMVEWTGLTETAEVSDEETEPQAENVAEVNGEEYSTLQAAIDAAGEGQTVTLLNNIALEKPITISKRVTINLNEKTISISTGTSLGYGFYVTLNGDLDLTGSGTIAVTGTNLYAFQVIGNTDSSSWDSTTGSAVLTIGADIKVTINADANDKSSLGVYIAGNGATLNLYGSIVCQNKGATIQGNGTKNETTNNGGTEINIFDSATAKSNGLAMYLPQSGTVNISGGIVEGYAAIGIKSGTLNITGGTVRGTANDDVLGDEHSDTNGIAYDGSAIVIDSYIGYAGEMNLNISGTANIESVYSTAIHEIGNVVDKTNIVTMNITGGSFSSGTNKACVMVRDVTKETVSISGGTFSSDVSDYLAEGVDLIANSDGTYTVDELDASNAAAEIGGQYYGTLTEAWSAALSQGTATITLLKNVSGQGVLDLNNAEANITVDLNGHDIGFGSNGCFQMQLGDLTLNGSGEVYEESPYYGPVKIFGNGTTDTADACVLTVNDGVTLRGWSAIFINGYKQTDSEFYANGVVVNVNGATLESVPDAGNAGGHAIYVQGNIKVPGNNPLRITLNGASLKATSGSDGDGNGMYLAGYAETVINNSTITAGDAGTGIEIRAGKLTINGDTSVVGGSGEVNLYSNGSGLTTDNVALAVAQHTTKLTLEVTINNGTFTGSAAFVEHNPQKNTVDDLVKVKLDITGGQFTSTQEGQAAVYSESKTEFISGGTFSSDPSAYVVPDKIALVQNNGMYTIETASKTAAEVVAGESEVKAAEGITEEVANALANTTAAGLTGEANTEANNNTVTVDQGTTALKEANLKEDNDGKTVTIVVQPYLDIEVTAYAADSSDTTTPNTMTLDITPMVRTVATTDPDDIELGEEGKNAVVMETAKELDVKGSIILTIPLPNDFAETGKAVYIQHKSYEYTATVESDTGPHITFVNPHGFSVFTVSTSSAAVAKVGGTSYISLQAAVDAVENNGTVTLLSNCDERVTVSRPVTFTLNKEGHEFTGSIVAGNGYTLTERGNKYVVTRTPVDPGDDDDNDNNNSGSSSSGSTSVRRYNIEADAGRGGDISPDGRVRVRRGENQTFRITADDGWEIADVEVDGESVGAVERYTFENVRTDHTISVTFRQIVTEPEEPETPALPFTDVAEGDWYHDAVAYCWENGIMDGTSGTAFAPNLLLNRAMMAQVLYNLAGGTPAAAAGFPDVAASAWYADAVNWAAANGYVTGYDNGSYGPEDNLTREQMAAILYRYAGSPAPAGSLDGFADAASASDYAVDALRWAVGEGLLTGKDGGRLDPTGTASRAELAQILARFAQM